MTTTHSFSPNFATTASLALTLALAGAANAAEYECSVSRKLEPDREYTPDQIARFKFSNRIVEIGEQAWVSRCSFTQSAGKVTCDRLQIDQVVVDPNVKIKKFYMFRSQFDLQLYPDLTYVENNGRGGISYGKCTLTAP